MRSASTTISPPPDQRKSARVDLQTHVQVDLPSPAPSTTNAAARATPATRLEADSLNLSEGGMCLRLESALQVRSRVRLRLFPDPSSKRPVECSGQVAWIVQRMDLRDSPPFLYDVGVQFIDPPPRLREFALRAGVSMKAPSRQVSIEGATINGRRYAPHLDHESAGPWHLVVWVEDVPCFSHRYASQREALEGWDKFRRQTAAEARQAAKPTRPRRRSRR